MRKLLLALSALAILAACNNSGEQAATTTGSDTAAATSSKPVEFADAKYIEAGRAALPKFEAGDIEGWLSEFADNAVFQWSNGDSLAGKPAIIEYWTNRRKNAIDSIKFSNDIWLPVKINTPQRGPDLPGTWLLGWYQVNVKYKTGKSLQFWVHTDFHYNSADKIDRAIQYIDFAPIKEANAK
ncbi:MAG TPA: lipoprotein [Chitinophagaceae bacterium]